jgi:hypothetical protein
MIRLWSLDNALGGVGWSVFDVVCGSSGIGESINVSLTLLLEVIEENLGLVETERVTERVRC